MKQASVSQGFFVLSRTNIIIKLISIIYVPVLLAIIGPAGHGDYALAYVYYGALVALLSEAITKTTIRQVSAYQVKDKIDQAVGFTRSARQLILLMSLILALVVSLASRLLAMVLQAPHLWLSLIILAISLIFVSLSAVYRAYFQASRRMEVAGNAQVIEHLINAVLTITLSWLFLSRGLTYSLAGAAIGTLLGGLASLVYLHIKFHPISRGITGAASWQTTYLLIRPMLAISLVLQLGHMLEALIVKQRLSSLGLTQELASMAYSDITSYKMAQSIPLILLSALATALYPAIIESVSQGDLERFYHRITQSLRHIYFLTLPAAAGIALVAGPLNAFAFDGRWQREQLMMAAAFMVIPMSLAMIQQAILQSEGRLMVSQLPLVASTVITAVFSGLLIRPPFGVLGSVLAGYVGIISLCLTNQVLLHRRNVRINYLKNLTKPLIASLVMSLVLIALKVVLPLAVSRLANLGHMIVMILVGGVVYGGMMLLLKGISRQDVSTVSPGLVARLPRFIAQQLDE
ncbi:MAG: oligosaccharide flippase family protein [Tissierellia bacterium]|nr:oligosaccharide flippase family protein [Tissierellia bacterium]